jgi:hypothetical protein
MKDVHPIVAALNDMRTDSIHEGAKRSGHASCRAIDDPGRGSEKPEGNWLVAGGRVEILRTEAAAQYAPSAIWGQTWV